MVSNIVATEQLTQTMMMDFGAATYVGEAVENPERRYRKNVAGSLSLLNAMRAACMKWTATSPLPMAWGFTLLR